MPRGFRQMNHVCENEMKRFYSNVKVSDGCWEYGSGSHRGYSSITIFGRNKRAHRFFKEFLEGKEQPQNVLACHSCDNRKCVNPSHVFWGTHKDNYQDMVNKDRRILVHGKENFQGKKTHCKRGHEFNETDTFIYKTKAGLFQRLCRICARIRQRRMRSELSQGD